MHIDQLGIFGEISIHMLCLFLMRLVVFVFLGLKSSGYSYLMGYMVYKYVLLLYGLSFHFLDSFLLSIFFLLSLCAFGVVSRKPLPNPRLQRFSYMLSCKSFVVLAFAFRPVIHLELIFAYDVR